MKEIRINCDSEISDRMALHIILDVIEKGKISGNGESYSYCSIIKKGIKTYMVTTNDKTKSWMFRIKEYNPDIHGKQNRR